MNRAQVQKLWITFFISVACLAASSHAYSKKGTYGDALDAYENYWKSFEIHDNQQIKDAKDKYQKAWADLKRKFDRELLKKNREQFVRLKESIKRYRLQLQEHPDANNRPHVLLNLAQVYYLLANFESEGKSGNSSYNLDYTLKISDEIIQTYPRFEHLEHAYYLKAMVLDSLNRKGEALIIWKKLAKFAGKSRYGLYAVVGMGDHYFKKDVPNTALTYYRRAKKILRGLDLKDKVYEQLRVNYRLAWASYRTADLDESIKAATALLELRARITNADQKEKIFSDAIELTGDALYEQNDMKLTKATLKRRDIQFVADSIGNRILKRFDTNNIYAGTIDIGEFLLKEFPLSKHLPEWYLVMGRAYEAQNQKKKKVEMFERLAMLLPRNSLWQAKYRSNFKLVKSMQSHAEEAARFVAAYYYDYGIASGAANHFMTAASYYAILYSSLPQHKEATHWRLRQAHCFYFGDRLDRAIGHYENLIGQFELDNAQLEVASYQLAIASEKNWRRIFSEEKVAFDESRQNQKVAKALKDFAERTQRFANRFPDRGRTVDLLLLTAAAYRDSNDYKLARTYWKRVLVSSPTTSQRLIAVRGLIYAEVNDGTNASVASLTDRFLKLEDWTRVDKSFRMELLGILSASTSDYARALNKDGKTGKAGSILVKTAQDHKLMPNREKHYRDGAYLLALADKWREAGEASEQYLTDGLSAYRADMIYLSGRSFEYRMDFAMATNRFLQLGREYPQHKQAKRALKQAEKLAESDGDHYKAAQAVTLLSRLQPGKSRHETLSKAVAHYDKASRHDLAKRTSRYQMKIASGTKQKLLARLNLARSKKKNGEESTSARELRGIASTLEKRGVRRSDQYADIAGETYYMLGEDTQSRFDDFNLLERRGNLSKNVSFKMKIYESLTKNYSKAIEAKSKHWQSRARYNLAQASGEFSDEIAKALVKFGGRMKASQVNRLNKTVERLSELRKSYHSQNVLARTKDPSEYRNNRWIDRSATQLQLSAEDATQKSGDDNLPVAIFSDMSNVWSH